MAAAAHEPKSRSLGVKPAALCLIAIAWFVASAAPGRTEPVHLKLSFFGSESIRTFQAGVKPFVDGVNSEGKGLVVIDVYPNGALGKAVGEQPALVLNGVADIAWVVPGQTPYRFPGTELLEFPGLIRNAREGSLAFTRLVAAGVLDGYAPFVVIGAYTTNPAMLHSRKPIASLSGLNGLRIRSNNAIEAKALERLGATPTVLPVSQLASAISKGTIDGASLNPIAFFDFGVAPFAAHHYLLRGGTAPLLVVMNRRKFDALPEAAKALIIKHSGERAAEAWFRPLDGSDADFVRTIKADPKRTVVQPSRADVETVQRVYRTVIEEWAAEAPRNRELLSKLEGELAKIRATDR